MGASPTTGGMIRLYENRYTVPSKWVRALAAALDEVAAAMRLLAGRARVVAEGAGALAVAAALSGAAGGGQSVCVVSGGDGEASVLGRSLAGENPAGSIGSRSQPLPLT